MSGNTQGDRKLSSPAVNATATPNEPVPSIAPSGSPPERGRATSAARARRWYYALKYAVFRKEQRAADGRRGLVVLQVDALAYADLRRALDQGYCPTLARLLREEPFTLRRWFCGLPSATPYCQAGILHGENAGIPAFRFYDKPARRVVTCNAPEGVQYIRDRIRSPGALQTLAVLLDVYLGVPVIYSTFMQYDELAHHFGPASRPALRDLRRTDARVAEIWRMIRSWGRRPYDLVVLSDHGMTPAKSYRVTFGESLGTTVQRILDGLARPSAPALRAIAIAGETSEYAEVGPRAFETMAEAAPPERRALRRGFRGLGHWVRSRYGLRELILPEKYRVGRQHEVVVTDSSCLAHVYFADDARQLDLADETSDGRRARLYSTLLAHPGIGLILSRRGAA